MMNLNLLPIQLKKRVVKNTRQIELINNLALVTISLIMVSLLLFISQKYLDYKINQMNIVTAAKTGQPEAKQINNKLIEVEQIQKNYIKWSLLIKDFLALIPDGNKIVSLHFDNDNHKLSMQGLADTRESFLALVNNLKKSDLVTDVKSPISNLLYQTNVNFSLTATLNF